MLLCIQLVNQSVLFDVRNVKIRKKELAISEYTYFTTK